MGKTINFDYKGKTYTLEFNREAVKAMERQGFNLDNLEKAPNLTIETLFAGAFIMHHRTVKPHVIEDILNSMHDMRGLTSVLAEMYAETASTLFDEPDEEDGDAKNVKWSVAN